MDNFKKPRQLNYKKGNIEISYPFELIDNRNNIPSNHVSPCSVLLNNEEIGGIFIACPSQDIEYFRILPSIHPEPPLKFRTLNFENRIFVIEIWMQFKQNPERYLKMHLNPHDLKVKKFLMLGAKTQMISFHFYNTDTHLLSSAITNFTNEETDWFVRNYNLSTTLPSDQRGYSILAGHISKEISNADRIYKYFRNNKIEFFVKDGGKQVILYEISKLN